MRHLYGKFILIFFLIIISLFSVSCAQQKETSPKHIVFITVDTTRADYLAIYGDKRTKTPNLDNLANDSVVFKQCYSTTHTTIPSHTSMFTSLYLKDHGVVNMGQVLPDFKDFLPKKFQLAGFKTAAFTSGGHLSPTININQGFDEFYYPEGKEIIAEKNSDRIVNWLDKNKGNNFFIWAHYFDAHKAYAPPPPFSTMYSYTSDTTFNDVDVKWKEKLERSGYIKRSNNDPEFFRNLYRGEISYMDSQIGRVISKLKELNIYNDTIIVLVADHGEYLGEHGLYFTHGGGIFDEVIHVPLFIKTVDQQKTDDRDQLVSIVDLYPTILGLFDKKIPQPIRGKSLIPIINNPTAPNVREKVYFESLWRTSVGEKTQDYTYIRDLFDLVKLEKVGDFRFAREVKFIKDATGRQQLFDNHSDKDQKLNIANKKKKLTASFENDILEFSNDIISVSKKAPLTTNKKQLNTLKSLGYMK